MNVPKLRFKEFDGEWEEKKLKDLILTVEAGVSVNSKDASVSDTVSKAVLKTSAISKGNFNQKENKKVIEEDLERVKKPVKADTILVSRMNTPALVGEVGYVENDYPNLYLPDRLWEVEVDKEITTAKWLVSALVTDKNEYKIKSLGTGTSGSMKNIAKSDFLNIDIKVPDLKEQFKIQSFMGILNKKIQLQQQKIDLLQEQKKGFLQKMFPKAGETQPEIRFAGFEGEWRNYKLKEITTHRGGTAIEKYFDDNGKYKVISIGSYGLDNRYVDQNIRALSNDVTDSRLVKKGELTMVLNDKTSNGTIIGRCLLIENDNEFVVNQRTEIITPKINFDNTFAYVLLNGPFREQVKKLVQGGTQIYVNYSAVEKLGLLIPEIVEQKKIGDFFKCLDEFLKLQQQKLELLKKQKQGFMQQMFI